MLKKLHTVLMTLLLSFGLGVTLAPDAQASHTYGVSCSMYTDPKVSTVTYNGVRSAIAAGNVLCHEGAYLPCGN